MFFLFFFLAFLISESSPANFVDNGLFDQACPYDTARPTKQCQGAEQKSRRINEQLQLQTINCEAKQSTKLCQEISIRYPFLKDQLQTCDSSGICGTQLLGAKKEALEGCQIGLKEAANHLGKELPKSAKEAEEMVLKWGHEISELLVSTPGLTWNALKVCFFENNNCNATEIKKQLSKLPEKTKNEILDLLNVFDRFDCLNNRGRFELLCYRSAILSAEVAGGGFAGGIGKLVFRETIIPVLSNSKRLLSTPNKKNLEHAENNNTESTKVSVSTNNKSSSLEHLETRFGKKVDVFVDYRGDENYPIVFLRDKETNALMGTMDVHYDKNTKSINVGEMFTYEEYRGLGVGEALFESILKEFPNVEHIVTSELTQTNRIILQEHLNKGKNIKDALTETPAYKIRSKFGYTEILTESIDSKTFGFKVRRPTSN